MSKSDLNDTWIDCLAAYKAQLQTMKPWAINCPPHVNTETLLSSPEIMDPQTDTGYDWKKIGHWNSLFATDSTNPPRDLSTLSTEELVELLDVFFAKEALYLRGVHVVQSSLLSFVYFHRMDLLRQKSPMMFAFVRCVVRTLVLTIQLMAAAQVHDDEEAIPLPVEIAPELEVPTEQLIAELELFARQASDVRIKSRLMFRVHLLHLLNQAPLANTSRTNAGKWFEIARAAVDALDAVKRGADLPATPVLDKTLFRHQESICWLTIIAVHKESPLPTFADAMSVFRGIVTQLASLSQLLDVQEFDQVHQFVESFALKAPCLLTRSVATLFLIPEKPQDMFLGRQSMLQWMWRTLAKQYGAPIYGLINDGDEATLRDVVAYRVSKTVPPSQQLDQALLTGLRNETTRAVRKWAEGMCQQFQLFWKSMLCNQGRAHRRLTNMLETLLEFQHETIQLEGHVFQADIPGIAKISEEEKQAHITRSTVLSHFVSVVILQIMTSIVAFAIHLQLLTAPEVIPAQWLLCYLGSIRQDTMLKLYWGLSQPLPVPSSGRGSKKQAPTINPLLTMRQTTMPPHSLSLTVAIQRSLAEIVFHTGTAMEMKEFMSFELPSTSLVTPGTIFNHRFAPLMRFPRPSIPPYSIIVNAVNNVIQTIGKDKEPVTAEMIIPAVIATAKRCADETKQFTTAEASRLLPFEVEYFQMAERTTRSLSAALSMLQAMDEQSVKKFTFALESPYRPFLTTLTMKRIPQEVTK